MKLSTMLMIGGAAYLGYAWAKKHAATAPATTTQALQAAPQPPVVVVEREVDYGPAWGWGPSVFVGGFGRGGHRHGHHGGHRGRH